MINMCRQNKVYASPTFQIENLQLRTQRLAIKQFIDKIIN